MGIIPQRSEIDTCCVIKQGHDWPTDTCLGDSGGPLFRERLDGSGSVQVAITSFATTFACAQPNTVSWYTRVSKFSGAIMQALENQFSEWDC